MRAENLSDACIQPAINKDTLLKYLNLQAYKYNHWQHVLYWCLNARRDICRFYYESDPARSCPSCSNDMNDPATFVIPLQGLELIKASPTVQDSVS
ncbi:hypothetical protein E1A91_D10G252500v1 [Gossypium mustelinum]|uniref:Uncharacterized protein n=5 Tax=Gossypium TaxID=3633 RepID=A0A0D2UXR8_GOSRA|nr:hypothetical protein ES319_D10G246700v1 [Gossypium barbadense]KJB73734.1 hypothetical protein B456_011G246700 [Gossypium raimondii]TYG51555.1 hypothetical protein ES288_D10G266900v1 [Gossypium darwinii]TYH51380.1 hypothetical protein ES332_D10G268900v1 [Gossypium tomentosum]TYI62553.1 hypothetical protein E1A91_D10G252500v1 [Gossypium mustelinum]